MPDMTTRKRTAAVGQQLRRGRNDQHCRPPPHPPPPPVHSHRCLTIVVMVAVDVAFTFAVAFLPRRRDTVLDEEWHALSPSPARPPRRIRQMPTLATTTLPCHHDDDDGLDPNIPRFDYPPVVFFAVVIIAPLPILPPQPPRRRADNLPPV